MTKLWSDRFILLTITTGVCVCVALLAGKITEVNININSPR